MNRMIGYPDHSQIGGQAGEMDASAQCLNYPLKIPNSITEVETQHKRVLTNVISSNPLW